MNVEYALARARAAVHREAKIAETVGARDLYGDAMEMADQRVVSRGRVGDGRDVLARDQ